MDQNGNGGLSGGRQRSSNKQKESMSLSRYLIDIDIHSACKRGDLEEVKRYLLAGGDIEKKKVSLRLLTLFPDLLSSLSEWTYSSDICL
jgi:hypothetical protein